MFLTYHVLATKCTLEAIGVVALCSSGNSFAGDNGTIAADAEQIHALVVVFLAIGLAVVTWEEAAITKRLFARGAGCY